MAQMQRRRYHADMSDLLAEVGVMAEQLRPAQQVAPPAPAPAATSVVAPRSRRRLGSRWVTAVMVIAGLGLIGGGIYVIAVPLLGVYQRGQADDQALKDWNSGGSQALVGAGDTHDTTTPAVSAAACNATTIPAEDYALVTFPSLSYGYAGVAGNGGWDELKSRSMVHYTTSAAPGAVGNVIIAFHREPHYEHIDTLKKGDVVTVQDRNCKVWKYTITQSWTLDPSNVTQLVGTTGHDLTLITCTPFWVDSQRIVWRATLTG